MSERKKRKLHGSEFKARVGLEAVRGVMTVNEIGQAHEVHPVQVSPWKKVSKRSANPPWAVDGGVVKVVTRRRR